MHGQGAMKGLDEVDRKKDPRREQHVSFASSSVQPLNVALSGTQAGSSIRASEVAEFYLRNLMYLRCDMCLFQDVRECM